MWLDPKIDRIFNSIDHPFQKMDAIQQAKEVFCAFSKISIDLVHEVFYFPVFGK
jgi:hypothetical protein